MTPEQEALLNKASNSHKAAELLATQGMHDFAVSRAYFAMLYVTEALLLTKGLSFSKHSGAIAAFGQHFAKPGLVPAEFHRRLIEAQNSRNVADYDAGAGLTAGHATEQIQHAREFLQLGTTLLAGPT